MFKTIKDALTTGHASRTTLEKNNNNLLGGILSRRRSPTPQTKKEGTLREILTARHEPPPKKENAFTMRIKAGLQTQVDQMAEDVQRAIFNRRPTSHGVPPAAPPKPTKKKLHKPIGIRLQHLLSAVREIRSLPQPSIDNNQPKIIEGECKHCE